MRKYLHVIIYAGIVGFAAYYFLQNRQVLALLENLRWDDLGILCSLQFLFFVATGYTFRLILALLKVDLTVGETIGLSMATNFGNYLGPTSPGAVLKAAYLKTVKGLRYSHFTAVFAVNNFLGFFVTGILGMALYFLFKAEYPSAPLVLALYSGVLAAGSFLFMVWRVPIVSWQGKIGDLARGIAEGFALIAGQKEKYAAILFSFVVQFVIRAALFYFVFAALGLPVTMLLAWGMAVYTSMFDFYLTPNNLGIQEAILAYLFVLGGFEFSQGMVAAVVLRVVHLAVVFAVSPLFMFGLLRRANLK